MNWNKDQRMSSRRCNVYSTVRPAGMCYWGLGGNSCCNLRGLPFRVGLSGHLSASISLSPDAFGQIRSLPDLSLVHRCRYQSDSCSCVTAWRSDRDVCAEDIVSNRKPGLMIHRWLRWLQRWGLGFVMVHVCDLFGCYSGRGPWQRGWAQGWMGVGSLVKPSALQSWCDSGGLMFTRTPGPLHMTIP